MDNWQLSQDTDIKSEHKKTQQQKPTKVDIKTSYKDSMRFEVYPPIRMKRGGAEWMEYMIDGSASRTNKLATIDNYSNDAFKEISSSNNFADIATNKHEEPNLKPKLSNEKVKIELAREVFDFEKQRDGRSCWAYNVWDVIIQNPKKRTEKCKT